MQIGISDTGLQPNLSQYSWMTNVTGSGLARWSGTSFSAPLVAGLIASQIPQSGSAAAAAQVVLQRAQQQAIPGVGPALVV